MKLLVIKKNLDKITSLKC